MLGSQSSLFIFTDNGSTDRLIELTRHIERGHFINEQPRNLVISLPRWIQHESKASLSEFSEVIIGSGSNIKYVDAWIRKAQEMGRRSYLLLDNWVNFENRFTKRPDTLIVTDPWARDYALSLYEKTIPIEMHLIDRSPSAIRHSGKVEEVIIASARQNTYTIYESQRHSEICVCPELHKANRHFAQTVFVVRPHPFFKHSCTKDFSGDPRIHTTNSTESLSNLVSETRVLLGPPSYSHYFVESLGMPALLSCKANANWHGPQFRYLD